MEGSWIGLLNLHGCDPMVSECYCPRCFKIKCPPHLWGGECMCIEELCVMCRYEVKWGEE
jgi:hypothetical protein